jgi:hypothetical protein
MRTKIMIDFYTKLILTIIAFCLIWICLKDIKLFPQLYASNAEIVDVRIRGIERGGGSGWEPIVIAAYDNLPIEVKNVGAIPVEVKNPLLPVDVKNVDMKSTLKPIEKK